MKLLTKQMATAVFAGVGSIGLAALPLVASANNDKGGRGAAEQNRHYSAKLSQLNDSGATGTATLDLKGRTLSFHLMAQGLEPGKVHPMHIHGKDAPEIANCPTQAQDANNDGFVSVIEGAGQYGLIKLNLTKPQTPFGPPATTALFTPFAGKANNANFPVADANGNEMFDSSYVFDTSAAAEGAFKSLTPLENQHIVLHGAEAPGSVDADAFALLGAPVKAEDMAKTSYDALLPVACGKISKMNADVEAPEASASPTPSSTPSPSATPAPASNASGNEPASVTFAQRFANLTAQFNVAKNLNRQIARDMYVRDFYEARNAFVDQMNRSGDVMTRDHVSAKYQDELETNVR